MTGGLFDYPQKAAFGKVLPKSKIFSFTKPGRRIRDLFAREVSQIVWRFKLAPETTNIPAGPGVPEIQVFGIELKPDIDELSEAIVECVDKSIAFPIFYEVSRSGGGKVKVLAAYKRPNETDSSKWVVREYFATGWLRANTRREVLPVAMDLAGLYEMMLRPMIPLPPKAGELLQDLVERHHTSMIKRRECKQLEAALKRERQFNRKVELNAQLRTARAEYDSLTAQKSL